MVGDRQRIAVLTIGEQELALVIGAPHSLGRWPTDRAVPWADDAGGRGARPGHGDRAPHGWCSWPGWEFRRICAGGARESCAHPSSRARASRSG